ncbi:MULTISPECIES: S24 family peptidase [unclassified Pseudomonas]|nr:MULTISPECIES: S24 family peptidase [unclassified Pseudomonas]MDG9925707.1 S24 family peptidase [Pseudomonas sp. GD04045]MDH0037176.1 S24 family peptidase [Pseudomonas sp. GD04019]
MDVPMSSLSILARSELIRERLLTDVAAGLRITGFQSPADDEKERGLSLDLLTDLGAPHMWPVRVLDMSLVGFGIFQGDRLVINRAAGHVDDRLVIVDLGSEGYQVRWVVKDMFGGRWLRAAESHIQDVQLDGEVPIEVWGVVRFILSKVAE